MKGRWYRKCIESCGCANMVSDVHYFGVGRTRPILKQKNVTGACQTLKLAIILLNWK